MNRIEEKLQALKKDNKKAFITYITAGFPDYNKTKELIEAQKKEVLIVSSVEFRFQIR